MLQIKTYLDKSSIDGIGVFAAEEIKKGQLVWKFEPLIDKIIEATVYSKLEFEFIKKYAYFDKQLQKWVLSVDNDRFTNHSNDPNTEPINTGHVIASRDISIGEEITINYFAIDEFAEEKIFELNKNEHMG